MSGIDATTKLLIGVAVVAWGAAGFFIANGPVVGARGQRQAPAPAASAPPPEAPPSATASASAAPPATPRACIASALPPPAFTGANDEVFADFCAQDNPLKGSMAFKAALVTDGTGGDTTMTEAMKEWAGLGWYQLAGYQVLRTRCCAEPPAYEWPFSLACPIDEVVVELGEAVKKRDPEATNAAIERFRAQAVCLDKFGQSQNFGQTGPPSGGRANLERLIERVP